MIIVILIQIKILTNYDIKRIFSRVAKEFGKIERGTEEFYNPQLDYIEHAIYEINKNITISDYELQDAISVIIYDLKKYIDNKIYDYQDIVDKKVVDFAKELEMLFNPFINKEIQINDDAKKNLKDLFTLPIICLSRIYDSIDFWRNQYGKNGYYRMLEEMVIPIMQVGKFPFALKEKYLIKSNQLHFDYRQVPKVLK